MTHVFKTLQEANAARQIEWQTDEKPSLTYWGNAIAGEVGEACNVLKKLERERMGMKGSRATVDDLGKELADAKIYIALLEADLGINGDRYVGIKFNETSEKYGFKTRMEVPGEG